MVTSLEEGIDRFARLSGGEKLDDPVDGGIKARFVLQKLPRDRHDQQQQRHQREERVEGDHGGNVPAMDAAVGTDRTMTEDVLDRVVRQHDGRTNQPPYAPEPLTDRQCESCSCPSCVPVLFDWKYAWTAAS